MTSPDAPAPPTLQRSPNGPFILLGLGLLGVGIAAWRPVPAGVWHDDGVYMLVGKALSSGPGFVYDGVVGTPPAAKFPPLYPALLGLLWAVFGGIGPTTLIATLLNLAMLAGAGGLFAWALHASGALSLRKSLAAAGLGFASTDLLRTALVPLSESLFVLLGACAFAVWVVATGPQRKGDGRTGGEGAPSDPTLGTRPLVSLGILLVACVATRSAGLALALAFTLALWTRAGLRAALLTTGPAIATVWLWGRWASAKSEQIPEGARDLLGPYGSWLLDQALTAPGAFIGQLPAHVAGLASRVAAIFVPGLAGSLLWVAAVPLGVVAVLGIARLLVRFPPLGWFALGYLAMLVLWPYLDRRLIAPIHPVLVAAVAVGASELLERAGPRTWGRLVGAAAVVWIAGYSVVSAFRIADGWPAAPYRLRAERLAAAVEAMERTVPEDGVVGAPEFWAALHLHGGWTVAPSVLFDPRSVDPDAPVWGTPDALVELWRTTGIEYLLLEQAGRMQGPALDLIEDACPESVFVLAQMETALLVKLEWSPACEVIATATPPSMPRWRGRSTPG